MIKKLSKNKSFHNTLIYISTDIINKAIPFLLLPIVTRYMSPSDYAKVAIFISITAILSILIGLNAQSAIYANYFKHSKEKMEIYISNIFLIIISSSLMVLIFVVIFHSYIEQWLEISFLWQALAILYIVSQTIISVLVIIFMLEEKAKALGVFQITNTLFLVVLTLTLVVHFELTWVGQLSSMLIVGMLFMFISIFILKKKNYIKLKFDGESIKDALKFGIPLVPHRIGDWIKFNVDKFLLIMIIGSSATGLYAVGYQIASMVMIISVAIQKAWQPFLYKKLENIKTENDEMKLVKLAYIIFLIIMFMSLVLYILSPYIITIFLSIKFKEVNSFIGYLILTNMFAGMAHTVIGYIMYTKKTKYLVNISIVTAMIHVLLSYVLISYNGIIGATQSSSISFLITFILIWHKSNQVYPMPWLLQNKRFNK